MSGRHRWHAAEHHLLQPQFAAPAEATLDQGAPGASAAYVRVDTEHPELAFPVARQLAERRTWWAERHGADDAVFTHRHPDLGAVPSSRYVPQLRDVLIVWVEQPLAYVGAQSEVSDVLHVSRLG